MRLMLSRVPSSAVAILLSGVLVSFADEPSSLIVSNEPPGPSATPAVESLLRGVEKLVAANDLTSALDTANRAEELARREKDLAGEALSYKATARVLESQAKFEAALSAWMACRDASRVNGDGPGEIEAVLAELRIRGRNAGFDPSQLLISASEKLAAEVRRPRAAVDVVSSAAESFLHAERAREAKELAQCCVEQLAKNAPGSLALARNLNILAAVAGSKGDLPAADRDYRRALEIQESSAPGSLDVAATLGNLGVTAYSRGDLSAALDYQQRALAIRESKANGSLEMASSLNNLGSVKWSQGDLIAARKNYQQALDIYEAKAPGSLEVASGLNNVGLVTMSQGDLGAAREFFVRAMVIKEALAPGSLGLANVLTNLGIIASYEGQHREAQEFFSRALEIRQAKAPGSIEVARTLDNLGIVASDEGDLSAARDFHVQALNIFAAKAPQSLDLAECLDNLGNASAAQGDYAGAREYHDRALAIKEERAPGSLDVSLSLSNLGNLAVLSHDYQEGRAYYLRSLAIKEAKAPESVEVAETLVGLGNVASAQSDWPAARAYFQHALEIQNVKAPGSQDVAASLLGLGDAERSQSNVMAARSYYQRALEIQDSKAPGSLRTVAILSKLGSLDLLQGQSDSALEKFARAWELAQRQAAAVTGDEARQAIGASTDQYGYDLAHAQVMVGKAREGFITLEQGRAQALLQLLALRGLEERLDDPSIWAAYEQVQTELQKAGKRLADASSTRDQAVAKHASERQTGVPPADSESGEAAVASAEVEREKAHSEYVRLRLELGFRLVDVRRAVPALRDDPVPLEDARRFLPSGSLWVAFAVGDADTLVFLVPATPGAETKAYIVPVTQVDLHERVSSLLRMVRQRPAAAKAARAQADRDLAASAHELYDLLFPEAVRPIVEKAAKLLISPDGVLWDLPFSALISNQQGEPQWLGLTKPLSYEQSLSAFVREGEKPRATGTKVLIAGNPTFGRREVTDSRGDIGIKQSRRAQGTTPVPPPVSPVDWTRGERSYFVTDGKPPTALPGTATEAIQVAALYGATPLLGSAATEPAVRKLIPYASVIHLATHGYFLPSLPMASGVMLATPEKEPEIGETDNDGVLQAFEFSGKLRLDANLVVLSACETGRGESVRGEGLIGLTRSLQIDGARTVVATHWRIDDRASSDLMVSFHRKVRNGIALDEALREAMAQVQRKPTTREPYYWAAFFLTGQRTPIAP